MCGIAGIITKNGERSEILQSESLRFRSLLKRRGPDSEGEFIDEKEGILFSHTRLSIIDLSEASNQPFISDDIVLIYNGEIYNFREIREELIKKGYTFNTTGDTEIIIKAYKEYGEDAFKKFIGMFAFVLYDKLKKLIYLVRDSIGIKPLYFYLSENKLIFSSEMRVFSNFETDDDFRYYFLLFGYIPNPFTTKKNIRALEKGSFLRLNLRDFSKNIIKYKDINSVQPINTNEKDALEKTREIFKKAVNRHLISDAPLGVFLSGGIDSSIISIVASEQRKERLTTLAVQFKETEYSEERYQNLIADIINSNHWAHTISHDIFYDSFEDIINAMDQPSIDGVNTYFVSKMAKEAGCKTVLSGLGGDELFMGYSYFDKIDTISRFSQLKIIPISLIKHISQWSRNERFRKTSLLGYKRDLFIYLTMRCLFIPTDISLLSGAKLDKILNLFDKFEDSIDFTHSKDRMNSLSLAELNFYLLGQLLKDTDAMSMWHSVETRVPFLDNELVDYILSIPSAIKYRKTQPKYLLTEAFRDKLPDEIIFRQKMGFTFPFEKWLRDKLNFYYDIVREGGLFDLNYIDDLFERFRDKKVNFSRIWGLVVLSAKKW